MNKDRNRKRIINTICSILVALMSFGIILNAQTHSRNSQMTEIEQQKKAADQEIKETKAELGANEKKVGESLAALRKIDEDIAVSQNEIETVRSQIATINSNITSLESNISKGEKELKQLREEYLKAVKKMRVARKQNSTLAFIFASKSFNEARRRMRYMREFSDWKDRRSTEIAGVVTSLQEQHKQLSQARTDATVALRKEETAQTKLSQQKKEQQLAVNELKANSESLKDRLSKRQAESRKLSNQISALIAEERAREEEKRRKAEEKAAAEKKAAEEKAIAERRAAEEKAAAERKAAEEKRLAEEKAKVEENKTAAVSAKQKNTTEEAKPKTEPANVRKEPPAKEEFAEARKRTRNNSELASNNSKSSSSSKTISPVTVVTPKTTETAQKKTFEEMKGALPRPVNGSFKIISAFGVHPISPELPDILDENLGIDAHVAIGATANAVFDGEVIKIYDRTNTPGFRNIVVVKHGDYITVYANMENLAVKSGQKVKQGQSLGTVGADFDDPNHGMIHFELWKNQTHLDPAAWIK